MFKENNLLNQLLDRGRRIIPRSVFKLAQPIYHWSISMLGAILYGLPSRSMKVIAVTGTKGKSTTVYMLSKVFEEQGVPVAAIGSLGYKIINKEWPNTLKMTMPGRMKLHKFMHEAKLAGAKFVILEATSEGIAQQRLAGIKIDCAVFTGLHPEHIESHGSFENYTKAKQRLFTATKNIHIINIDDKYFEKFINISSQEKITFGMSDGDINQKNINLNLKLAGDFNVYNALAALSAARAYGLDVDKAKGTLQNIDRIPGRMEFINKGQSFNVVIDYAHTPESLIQVYQTLKSQITYLRQGFDRQANHKSQTVNNPKLICVLGAAGGGRDKWKRHEFGRIASEYCDEIILTNEDPYEENPEEILKQIASGFPKPRSHWVGVPTESSGLQTTHYSLQTILDRKEAIKKSLADAREGDTVIITGKGSETTMAVAGGKKILWSDKSTVEENLIKR
ncbi:MAG: UDP-N-acetylmuramyl-tripeptide synthetase [bacterium]|nr:UDP-N-acetylmuramyl-tripeptide synthetase [bacterium]